MKTFRYLFALLCICALCSCEKDPVPADKVRINIQATGYDAVKELKDIDGNYYFTGKFADNHRLRITYFIYKYREAFYDNDILVETGEAYLDDVTGVAGFKVEMDPGAYRVVTTADFVQVNNDKVIFAYNDVKGDNNSISVNVDFKNMGGCYNAVGYAYSDKLVLENGGEKQDVSLDMLPAGALITTCFYNVNAADCKAITFRMTGAKYQFGVISQDTKGYTMEYGTEDVIKPVSDKTVYYLQRYVLRNGKTNGVSWAGIMYWNEKAFGFIPGVNNMVKIDISTDEAVVYDDVVKQ